MVCYYYVLVCVEYVLLCCVFVDVEDECGFVLGYCCFEFVVVKCVCVWVGECLCFDCCYDGVCGECGCGDGEVGD